MSKFILRFFILIMIFSLGDSHTTQSALAQTTEMPPQLTNTDAADLELAERYVPVFYFHPDEVYLPQPVEILNGITRLRHSIRLWFDTTIQNNFSVQDFSSISSDTTYFLDQWLGDTGSSEYANYSSHQQIYESSLSPQAGGPAPLVYAYVVHDENPQYITIQYWLFYFYQDWFNKHEGDWEMVEVTLSADGQPEWVVYSQHHGGTRRSWATTPIENGTHPVVYVARGSHANYFAGNEVYPYARDIGNRKLVLVDRTGSTGCLVPEVRLLPSLKELEADPKGWPGAEWLMFRGRWGETAVYGDFNGPYGPADKGLQWDSPYTWGISQTMDTETWYIHRLKVEITGPAQTQAHVSLIGETGQIISNSESIDNLAILHAETPAKLQAQVQGAPGAQGNVIVTWPDCLKKMSTRMSYSGFRLDDSGHAQLELSSAQAVVQTAGEQLVLSPQLLKTFPIVCDAPDSVLFGTALPVYGILGGLLICLLISIVPVLFLVAILLWVDRFHKEPIRFLFYAFSWGAVPALVIAFFVQLFFKPSLNLMTPYTLEVIRLGFLAPVLEEILKAAGVLFIFWRYGRQIDDVLDAMIYAAIVGFGFAFMSNLFRYASDFIVLGYPALNLHFVVERTVHVLNHGLYTAIFGACLGFAKMSGNRRRFLTWIGLGLLLAIATHALQNILSNSLVGLNVFTVIVTSAGILLLLVVAGWSLVKQRQLLHVELQGVLPVSLYASVQDPLVRARAQWSTLRRDGLRTWIRVRRLQGLSIKLAQTRLQARLHPEKFKGSDEVEALQAEINRIFNSLGPHTG